VKLYLLRHGKADWPDWTGPDDDRPLTDEGIDETRAVAAALRRLKLKPGVIFTSPLPRAHSTAQIAARALDVPLEVQAALEPGFGRAECDTLLASRPDDAEVMIVGHEPDFSTLIRSFTGGRVKLGKSAVAAIELPVRDCPVARLLWLFPAKTLIRLYG
jgi:phosphohistidine phosphatase